MEDKNYGTDYSKSFNTDYRERKGPEVNSGSFTDYTSSKTGKKFKTSGKDNRVLAGILISFSSTENGEHWPIYIGENVIGKSDGCNVVLGRSTVSERHANLKAGYIGGSLIYHLTVLSTSTFLQINNIALADNAFIHENDKIGIGGYTLMLLVVDPVKQGLEINEEFIKDTNQKKQSKTQDDSDGYDYMDYDKKRTRE